MVAHYYIPQQHVRIETYSVVRCALACFVCLTILGCQEPKTSKAPSKTPSNSFDIDPQAEGRSLERNRLEPHGDLATAAVKMKGYLGIDSCRECHAERVKDFQQTRHFLACVRPTEGNMPSGFTSIATLLKTNDPGLHFEMKQTNDEFQVTAVHSKSQNPVNVSSSIAFVYGSRASTDEAYFAWQGEKLYELPVAWLHPQNEWATGAFDTSGVGNHARELKPRCFECHNTYLEHVSGTVNQYNPNAILLGVTCEVCHGPGKEHVELNQSQQPPDDQAIVRPGEMVRQQLLDLCGQCHSNAIRSKRESMSYRPGEPIEEHFKVLETQYPEQDRVANQMKYMKESKCFTNSDTLNCVTCHNPHKPEDKIESGFRSCLQCHQPESCGERTKLSVSIRDDCSGCHMPARKKVQVSFDTANEQFVMPVLRYEHRIGVYPEAGDQVRLEWARTQPGNEMKEQSEALEKALATYWESQGISLAKKYRFAAAIAAYQTATQYSAAPTLVTEKRRLATLLSELERMGKEMLHAMELRRYDLAKDIAERILMQNPDHAQAHARLGTMLAIAGNKPAAVEKLSHALWLDPNDVYPAAMKGWLAFTDGKLDEALKAYREADAIEPRDPNVYLRISQIYIQMRKLDKAEVQLRELVSLNTDFAEALHLLASVLRDLKRADEAIPFAERAVELTSRKSVQYCLGLIDTYLQTGKEKKASELARQLLKQSENLPQALPKEVLLLLRKLIDQ